MPPLLVALLVAGWIAVVWILRKLPAAIKNDQAKARHKKAEVYLMEKYYNARKRWNRHERETRKKERKAERKNKRMNRRQA